MNYDIFDENYYLTKYPFVRLGVEQGIIASGSEHFQRFGQAGGLTEVSRYFDESHYLDKYPWIADAVNSGVVASGLDHFIQFGYESGLTAISSDYDENFYLDNNRELIPFIDNQTFRNGLEHFLKFGIEEGRFGTSFLEPEYIKNNPDVARLLEDGTFRTGRHHYESVGQFDPSRSATFVGGPFDDTVAGFGVGTVELIGVEVGFDADGNRLYEHFDPAYGTVVPEELQAPDRPENQDRTDLLIGSPGTDIFVLDNFYYDESFSFRFFNRVEPIQDLAIVQNYDPEKDIIRVAGDVSDAFMYDDEALLSPEASLALATSNYLIYDNGVDLIVSKRSNWINPLTFAPSFEQIAIVEGATGQTLNLESAIL